MAFIFEIFIVDPEEELTIIFFIFLVHSLLEDLSDAAAPLYVPDNLNSVTRYVRPSNSKFFSSARTPPDEVNVVLSTKPFFTPLIYMVLVAVEL